MTDGIRSYMTSTAAPLYHDILIPKYDFGAKRPVMDHGYLAITNMPNFRLIKCDGVKAVSEDGRVIVDNAGGAHLIDIVILANGFKTQELLTPMEIRGQTGTELRNLWREKGGARAYMGYVPSQLLIAISDSHVLLRSIAFSIPVQFFTPECLAET